MSSSTGPDYEITTFRPSGFIAPGRNKRLYFHPIDKPKVELKSLSSVKTVKHKGRNRVQVELVPKSGTAITVIVSAFGARKLRESLPKVSPTRVEESKPSSPSSPASSPRIPTFFPITSLTPRGMLEADEKGRFRFKYAGLFGDKLDLGVLRAAHKLVTLGKGQVRLELVSSSGETFHIVTKEKAADKVIRTVEASVVYYSGKAQKASSGSGSSNESTSNPSDVRSQFFGVPNHWKDAESIAASHMKSLGLQSVTLSSAGSDGGLDILAEGAAAQVKFRSAPTGSPEIQQFGGAAIQFPTRLFYSNSYSSKAVNQADALGIALFTFASDGAIEAVNRPARTLAKSQISAPDWANRSVGEKRQSYVFEIAQLVDFIQTHEISNSDRKARKELENRRQALSLLGRAETDLNDVLNPIYSASRQERRLADAARLIHAARQLLSS